MDSGYRDGRKLPKSGSRHAAWLSLTHSEHGGRFLRRRLTPNEFIRMDEVIREPGVALWIEQGLQPVHEKRDPRDAARVRVIGHPDIDLMFDADIDRDEIAAERHDVGRQSADTHAEFDRAAMRRTGVGAQRDDAFACFAG